MARRPPRRPATGKEPARPRSRRFRHLTTPQKIPEHPYRDSALLHGGLALVLVGIAWLTGGGLVRAAVIGLIYFTGATSWAWWRFRRRIEEAGRASAESDEPLSDGPSGNGAPHR
jgi:hypothetical protein